MGQDANDPPQVRGVVVSLSRGFVQRRGRASLTVRGRPPMSLPSSSWIAVRPASSGISTKPKPRERWVSRSVMTLAKCVSHSWQRWLSLLEQRTRVRYEQGE